MFLRFTALITAIIFSFNTIAFGQISAPEPRPFQPLQIIHIQDAHANYTAQKNICELIERFQKEQGIDLVFVEGAVGPMDAKNLRFSPDPSINKKVTDKLARMGELSGADLYLLKNHAFPVQFMGLEDPKLYAKNLESFRAVFAREKETTAKLRAERAQLDLEASRLNNKNLLILLRHYLNFELEKNQIQKTVLSLDLLSRKKLNRNFRDAKEQKEFPNLVRLLRLMDDESKINLEAAKNEAKQMGAEGLLDRTDRNPRFLLEEFYASQPKGFDFKKYPNFSTLAKNRVYQYELKSQGLFDELLKLMTMLFDALSVTQSEKDLIRRAKEYVTQSRLASLALTREEWNNSKKNAGDASSFYQTALEREKHFTTVIDETMRKNKKQRAIVIAGGFHTEGLKSEFTRRGIDCQVVAPEIKEASREIYINSVLGNYRANLDRSQFPAADWDNGWNTQSEMKVPVTARQALVTELIAEAGGSSLGTNDERPNSVNLSEEDLVKNLLGQLNVKLPVGQYLGVYAGKGEEYFAAFEGARFVRVDLIDLTADTVDTFDSLMDLESLFGRKISKERIAGINAQAILKERERIRLKQKAIKQLAPSKQVEAKKPLVKKAKPQKKVEEPLPPYLALLRLVHAGKVGKALLRPVSDLELSKKAEDFLKSLSPDQVMTIGKLSKLVNDGIFNQPDIDKSIADEIMGKLDPLRVQHTSSYSLSDLQAMVGAGKMKEVLAQPVTVFNFSPQTMFVLNALSWRDIRNDPFTIGELMHLDGEIILGAPQSDHGVLKEIEKKLALLWLSLPDHGLLSRPISYLHLDAEAERDLKEISNDRFGREMTIRELLKPGWKAVIEQISEHPTATIVNVRAKLKHFELDWEPEEGASSDGGFSDGASLGAQEDLKKSISNTLRFWEAHQFFVNSIWPPVSMPVKSYVQINARAGVRFRGVIAGRKRSEKVSGPGMSRSKKSGSLFPRKRMLVTPTMFFLVRNNLETALTVVEEGNLEIERLIQEPLDDFRNVIQEERIRGEARKFSESMEGNFIQIFEALGRAKESSAKSLGTDLSRLSRLTGFSRAQIEGMNAYTIESEDAKIGMYELISWALDADWYYQEASEKTKQLLLSAVSRRHRKAPSVLPRPVYEELDYKIGRDAEALQELFADFSRIEEKLFAELKKFWETEKIKAGRKYARRNLWRRSVPRVLKALDSMFEFEVNSGWRDRVLDRLESKGFLGLEQADKFTQSVKGLRERYQEKFKALELKAKELEKKLDQWDGKKNGSPSSSDIKMLRARLIKELEPYLDLISIAKKYRVSKRKPDVFFVLTNPDVRTFVELASIWKSFANVEEDSVQIPIVVSGGMRTGGKPQLLAHLSEYYRSKWPLSKLKEFQADSVTEAEIVKGILEFEGVAPEAISIEKESANTPESFMKAIYVLLRILEPKKGKSPVIQLVTCPPLNLRVRQTAYKQWKDFINEDGGWRILVRPIYPPVSYHRSDEELLHLFGYVLGFPKDYHVHESGLNRTSEVERIIEYSGKESTDVAPFNFQKFGWNVERVRELREGLFKDYLMMIEPAAFGKSLGEQKNKPNFSKADFLKLEVKTGISAKVLQGYFAKDRKDSTAGERLLIEKALSMVQTLEYAGRLKREGLRHYDRMGGGLFFRISGLSAKWVPAKDDFEKNANRVEWLFDRFFSRFKSFWEQERSRASVRAISERTRFDSLKSAKTSFIRIAQHVRYGEARQALRESVEEEGFISHAAAEKFLKDQEWLFAQIRENLEKVRKDFDLVSDFTVKGASLGAADWQRVAALEKYAGHYPIERVVFNSSGTRFVEIFYVNDSPVFRLRDAQTGLPVEGDLGKPTYGNFFGFSPDGSLVAVNNRRLTPKPSSPGIDLGFDVYETVNLYRSDDGNLIPGRFGKKASWEQVRGRLVAFTSDSARAIIQENGYVKEEREIPFAQLTRAQRETADPDSPPTEEIETNDRWFGLHMRDVKTGNPVDGAWGRGMAGVFTATSPSGKWIAVARTVDHKETFRLVDSETGEPHKGPLGKDVPGRFMGFAPHGKRIIKQEFPQLGHSVIFLLNERGLPVSKEWENGIPGYFQGFTQDGSLLVLSSDRRKFFYDIKTGKPAAASDIHSNNQTQDDFPAEANQRVIAYSPDRQTAIVVNPEGNAEVWKKQSDGKSLGESKIESKLMRVNIRDLKKQLIFTGSLMAFVAFIFAFPDAFHDFFYQVRPLSPTFYFHEFLHGSWSVDHLDIPDWAKSMIQFPPIRWSLSVLEQIEHPVSHWFVQKASDFMGIWGYAEKGKYVSNILPNFADMIFGASSLRISEKFHAVSLEEGKWQRFFWISSYAFFFLAIGYFTFSVVYFISDTFGWDKSLHGGDYSGFSNFFFGLEPGGFRTFLCGAMVFSFGFFFVDGIRFLRQKVSPPKNKSRFKVLAVSASVFTASFLTLAVPTLRFMQKNDRSQITGTEIPAPQMVDGRSLGELPDNAKSLGTKEENAYSIMRLPSAEILLPIQSPGTDFLFTLSGLLQELRRVQSLAVWHRAYSLVHQLGRVRETVDYLFQEILSRRGPLTPSDWLEVRSRFEAVFHPEMIKLGSMLKTLTLTSPELLPSQRKDANEQSNPIQDELLTEAEKLEWIKKQLEGVKSKSSYYAGIHVHLNSNDPILRANKIRPFAKQKGKYFEPVTYYVRKGVHAGEFLEYLLEDSQLLYDLTHENCVNGSKTLDALKEKFLLWKYKPKIPKNFANQMPSSLKNRLVQYPLIKKLLWIYVTHGFFQAGKFMKDEELIEEIKRLREDFTKNMTGQLSWSDDAVILQGQYFESFTELIQKNDLGVRISLSNEKDPWEIGDYSSTYDIPLATREEMKEWQENEERFASGAANGASLGKRELGLADLGHNLKGYESVNHLTGQVLLWEDISVLGEKVFNAMIGIVVARASSLGDSVTAVVTNDYFVQNAALLLKTMQRGDKIFVLVKTKSDIDNLKPFDKRIVPVRQSELKDLLSDKKNIFSLEFLTGDSLTVPAANRDMFRFKWDNDILTDLISNRDLLVKIRKFLLTDLEQRKTLLQQEGITPKGGFWFLDKSFVEFINKIAASSLGTQALQRAA